MGQVQHLTTGAPVGQSREEQRETAKFRSHMRLGSPGAETRSERLALIDEWRGLQGLRQLSFFERLRVR